MFGVDGGVDFGVLGEELLDGLGYGGFELDQVGCNGQRLGRGLCGWGLYE